MNTISLDTVRVGDVIRFVEDKSCGKIVSIDKDESCLEVECLDNQGHGHGIYFEVFEDEFDLYEKVSA